MPRHRPIETALAEHPFLAGLEARHVELLAGCARNIRFAASERIFESGGAADDFYLLRSGRVALEVHVPGRGPVTLQTLDPPDVLGWSWLVPPYRWQYDARTVEATAAFALDGKCLRGKCEDDHELGYQLYRRFLPVVQSRLQSTRMQMLDVFAASPAGGDAP